jgi:dTDP-glucose pyrophosphorylase
LLFEVADQECFCVAAFYKDIRATLVDEKPARPKSVWAFTCLFYNYADVVVIAKSIRASLRRELQITDVNRTYLTRGDLHKGSTTYGQCDSCVLTADNANQLHISLDVVRGMIWRLRFIVRAETMQSIDQLMPCQRSRQSARPNIQLQQSVCKTQDCLRLDFKTLWAFHHQCARRGDSSS